MERESGLGATVDVIFDKDVNIVGVIFKIFEIFKMFTLIKIKIWF